MVGGKRPNTCKGVPLGEVYGSFNDKVNKF